ncbi:DUF2332 domain-containing protein [Streptomyces sp. Ru73]|uniref:DUF2332 family protein n=1 Tax=Streptomyces sp. Ru73 TaxID=2080748 RepID=UPI000CDD0236|nr:DUF2332 family protein [Streptomyces sp. Ru73]POX39770.1 DUF2332 domain-containing protein [Streptomyces sp. Ru73]
MVVNSAQAVADRYADFSWQQARGESDAHEELTARISRDPEFCDFLGASLPPGDKRQPGLLLAAVRYLDGPHAAQGPRGDFAYRTWREWTIRHWDDVRDVLTRRSAEYDEPARCAALLPLLAGLPQPLALLEAGASAGLCLYPDRYRYRYDGGPETGGPGSPVVLPCRTSPGTPVPAAPPRIVWRAGIGPDPLDAADPDDVRWLRALDWPEAGSGTDAGSGTGAEGGVGPGAGAGGGPGVGPGVGSALEAVRGAPPASLVRGDLLDELPALAARAPREATLVVFHTDALGRLPLERREEFVRVVRSLLADRPGHWVSLEHHDVLPWLPGPRPADPYRLTLAVDGRPVAFTGRRGRSVEWLAEPRGRDQEQ